MRTILATLVTGIFVCLITSIGVDTELEMYKLNYDSSENITERTICDNCYNYDDDCIPDCEIEVLEQKLFGNFMEEPILDPNDINVVEVEEEIIIPNFKVKN